MTWHGHHHSYQRSCPVYNETCVGYDEQGVARGTVHLVIGNAGAGSVRCAATPPLLCPAVPPTLQMPVATAIARVRQSSNMQASHR